DWSSDVCSSDLPERPRGRAQALDRRSRSRAGPRGRGPRLPLGPGGARTARDADGSVTMPKPTPSQTVGPFFARDLLWKDGGIVLFPGRGERITLTGCVFDGNGAPIDLIKDDPLARAIGDLERLRTLVATPDADDPKIYRWDVRLRGPGEAVFIEF